jgi:hypothetical protein
VVLSWYLLCGAADVSYVTAPYVLPGGAGFCVARRLHRLYRESGVRSRDDTRYMRRIHPEYELRLPRW